MTLASQGAEPLDPRERILVAARRIFLDGPPEQATMDAVAAAAGMSKKTIYRSFKSQFELLTALLDEVAADFEESPPPASGADDAAIEAALGDMMTRLVTFVLSSRAVALYRLIISEMKRYPELMVHVPENPYPADIIARWLSAPAVRKRYDLGQVDEAASMLLGMVAQDTGVKLLLPAAKPLDPGVIERRARTAARVFLRGLKR